MPKCLGFTIPPLACRFLIDRQIKDIADLSSAVRPHACSYPCSSHLTCSSQWFSIHLQIWYDFQLEGSPQELQLFLDGFALLRTHSISLLRDGEQLEVQRGEGGTAHSGRTFLLCLALL